MSREIYRGRLIRLDRETASLPDGREVDLDIVHHPGGAVIVALNERREVCLLRQYRHAAGGTIWELPAGCIDPGEADPLATARRELEEEAGVLARDWQPLGPILTTPGFCDEVLHLYLARGLSTTRTDHGVDEVIEVCWLALSEALAMIMDNRIHDAKSIVGLFMARERCPA